MPLTVENLAIYLTWGKCFHHDSNFNFFQIGLNLAGYQQRQKKSWLSSIMNRIGSFHLELYALECFLSMGKMLSPL